MLAVRTGLAIAMVAIGALLIARMFGSGGGGLALLPGIVLGGAMIGLGAHRLSLIARIWRAR